MLRSVCLSVYLYLYKDGGDARMFYIGRAVEHLNKRDTEVTLYLSVYIYIYIYIEGLSIYLSISI